MVGFIFADRRINGILLGKNLAVSTIKNMKKIVIEQISRKVENLWNSIQKFWKTLSFQKFISAKIGPPR